MATNTDAVQQALEYAAMGFEVFPASGKTRLPKGWPDVATKDEEAVISLFERYPLFGNVAVKCGQISGLVDVNQNGPGGEKLLAELFGGEIPITPQYPSTRGPHWWLLWRLGFPDKARYFLGVNNEIEIIPGNSNAYTLAPPSTADGFRREWLPGLSPSECPLAEISDEVLARLVGGVPTRPNGKPGDNGATDGGIFSEGKRNVELARIAGSYRRAGLGPVEIYAALAVVNRERCEPPLADAEISTIANSISRYDPESEESELADVKSVDELIAALQADLKLDGLRRIVQVQGQEDESYHLYIEHEGQMSVVVIPKTGALFNPAVVRQRLSARLKLRIRRFTQKPWERHAHHIIQAARVVECDTRAAIVARCALEYLENCRTLRSDQKLDVRGVPCRMPTGEIAFSGETMLEEIGRSIHKITPDELTHLLKEAGRRERRFPNSRRRYYVLSEDGMTRIYEIAGGAGGIDNQK